MLPVRTYFHFVYYKYLLAIIFSYVGSGQVRPRNPTTSVRSVQRLEDFNLKSRNKLKTVFIHALRLVYSCSAAAVFVRIIPTTS